MATEAFKAETINAERLLETVNEIRRIYVDGDIGDAANPGTYSAPVATVAQALVLAKAKLAADPTYLVSIYIASSVAAEAIVVEDTDFTRLAFVGPEGRVTMTSFQSKADNENLTHLFMKDINFTGNFELEGVNGGSLLSNGYDIGHFEDIRVEGTVTLKALGRARLRNFRANELLTAITIENAGVIYIEGNDSFFGVYNGNTVLRLVAANPRVATPSDYMSVLVQDGAMILGTTTLSNDLGTGRCTLQCARGASTDGSRPITVGDDCRFQSENSFVGWGAASTFAAGSSLRLYGANRIYGNNVPSWTIDAACTVTIEPDGVWDPTTKYVDAALGNDKFNGHPDWPFKTIQAAINAITDASATKRYVIKANPGDYAENLTLKPFIEIQGNSTDGTLIETNATAGPGITVPATCTSETLISNCRITATAGAFPLVDVAAAGVVRFVECLMGQNGTGDLCDNEGSVTFARCLTSTVGGRGLVAAAGSFNILLEGSQIAGDGALADADLAAGSFLAIDSSVFTNNLITDAGATWIYRTQTASEIAASGTVNTTHTVNMAGAPVQTVTIDGATAFDVSGLGPSTAYQVVVLITASGGDRATTWDANWKWLGLKPATIASGATGMLTLLSAGGAATDVVAAYELLGTGV